MPEIKLRHVVSCSSEDSTHKADNLLSSDTYRKWKAARPGEKQTSVILQFDKEEQVHSIDIGNEGSAFVEVLVGHSTSVKDQDFEVLLVTSSFMSPTESRGGTNMNRVRFFGPQQLVKAQAQERWDRVKIVCSQPYSKTIAYGIAFIKFHSPPDNSEAPAATPPKLTKLGQFRVKDECPSSGPSLQPGSLFFSRDTTTKSSPGLKGKITCTHSQHPTGNTLQEKTPEKKPDSKPKPKARPKTAETVPLNKILEGVVFVLSGFQNPFRGELREKALVMGAKYRPDWTPDSTHLICAFANTPKYGQVKAAGGLIVRKEWVLDCHKRKQKISYKRYLMDGAESSSEESTPEDDDRSDEEKKKVCWALLRVEMQKKKRGESAGVRQRGGGREERKSEGPGEKENDPYGGSTDENTDAEEEEDKPIPELPDFLTGKWFYLYGKFPENQRRLLQRYIVAFNGAVEDYMSEKVQFVITSQGWDDSFEDALMENGNLSFVKPSWIFAINDRQKMLPYQPYTVVP
uniref:DNA repair protein XRCC1 n=1 Tax=Pygocentrus nattereri TaxID=42514 RepID=A0AAR2KSN3_PYGNA